MHRFVSLIAGRRGAALATAGIAGAAGMLSNAHTTAQSQPSEQRQQQQPMKPTNDLMRMPNRPAPVIPPDYRMPLDDPMTAPILGISAFLVLSMLGLSIRSSRRTARIRSFLAAAEKTVNSDARILGKVGRLHTAGSYNLSFADTKVTGFATVAVPGRLTGTVHVEAVRETKKDPWVFQSLVFETDRAALEDRNAKRAAVAEAAGYTGNSSTTATASPSTAAEGAAREGMVEGGDASKYSIKVI